MMLVLSRDKHNMPILPPIMLCYARLLSMSPIIPSQLIATDYAQIMLTYSLNLSFMPTSKARKRALACEPSTLGHQ